MTNKKKNDPIPEELGNNEEAAEFWEKHDATKYLQNSRPAKVVRELRERRYEIEIDENVAKILRKAAREKGVTPSRLASDLSKQRLGPRAYYRFSADPSVSSRGGFSFSCKRD